MVDRRRLWGEQNRPMQRYFSSNSWRHLAGWPVIALLASLNGIVREKVYLDRVGEEASHRISTLPLIAFILGIVLFLARRWPLRTARQAWAMGVTWLAITEVFELGLGRLEGRSWAYLFHEYNIFAGRIWPLALLTTLCAPELARRLVVWRDSARS